MRALILAGGMGIRLSPYTAVLPKPLLPIGTRPVLRIVVEQLVAAGATDITIAVGYLGDLIEAYFGNGSRFGARIDYIHETQPLGTVGCLGRLPRFDDHLIVTNADILTTLDFVAFMAAHRERGTVASVATCRKAIATDYGIVHADADGYVTEYEEKPKTFQQISTGVYAFAPAARAYLPQGRSDVPELVQAIIRGGGKVYAHDTPHEWLDIGRADNYEAAGELVAKHWSRFTSSTDARGQEAPEG